ncbi:protein-histidine kinase [Gigaspora margarita]|uniref:Protein-histidine kinase n=1 Tax=Gigaspora margarita TaxID=4874 RepID=A0A8H3X5S8_GIGMA|nr:protein-histidine kinase [Gigaspora margarita]
MQQQEFIDENKENSTYGQTVKRGILSFELCDTGIGIDPKYIQRAWESFSQGDMSITKEQNGAGLGLSICKSLVEINGGEIKTESQLGKGSKFSFTWNVEPLSTTPLPRESQFNERISYALPHAIRSKRILIIHSVESVRNSLLKYFKRVEKVDAVDTFDEDLVFGKFAQPCERINYPLVDNIGQANEFSAKPNFLAVSAISRPMANSQLREKVFNLYNIGQSYYWLCLYKYLAISAK